MVDAVYHVADVVHVPRYPGKLAGALVVAKFFQYLLRKMRHARHMGKAVLGVTKRLQGVVRALDIRFYLSILFYLLWCYHSVSSIVCAAGRAACSSTTKAVAKPPSCVRERCAVRPFCRITPASWPENAK